MTTSSEAERLLLEEGVDSYVPAVSAILAFRELVQSRCQQVVEHRLAEYRAALGVPPDKCLPQSSEWPPTKKWDGKQAYLGVEIKDFGIPGALLYHQLYWELGEGEHWTTGVGASIWLGQRDQLERLWNAFHPHPGLTRWKTNVIGLHEQVSRTEVADFDKKLDGVLCQWIKLWERAGGLKVLGAGGTS